MSDHQGGAPTGCFKCGRPGHWSRDCSSLPSSQNSVSIAVRSSLPSFLDLKGPSKALAKPKKLPKSRPKLTPDLLLSEHGIGYVLSHFPHHFKYRGKGHEVDDLGELINLYSEWHSRLLPYFPFNQFIRKVEQVGSSKRVKVTIRELRQRVEKGEDLVKATELYSDEIIDTQEVIGAGSGQMVTDGIHEMTNLDEEADISEAMIEEMYQKSTTRREMEKVVESVSSGLTEQQRVRMESSRLTALQRSSARTTTPVSSSL